MTAQEKTKKSPQKRTRNVQMVIRATQDEKDFIMDKMRKSGAGNFNIYALKMLVFGEIKNVDLTHYHELAKEVSRVGTNINQIVKFANANGRIYEPEIEDLQCKMEEIWQLLRSSLSGLQSKKL